MKLLKLFGIVAGLHAAALVLIFANPGCSTTPGPRPSPNDTALGSADTPVVSVPYIVADHSGDPASTQLNAFGGDGGSVPLFVNEDAQSDASSGRARPTRPRTPVTAPLNAPPKVEDVTPASTYTVVRGDSLWTIAKRNKLTVADLAAANNIPQGAPLQIGRKLIIPAKSAAASSEATASTTVGASSSAKSTATATKLPEPKASLVHVVRSGETLGGIARRYQVRVGDIALANNIADPAKIQLGQTLVIPGGRVSTTVTSPRSAQTTTPATTAPKSAPPATATQPTASQIESTPALSIEAPEIVEAPPIDRPLDDGFGTVPDDAPVIDIED